MLLCDCITDVDDTAIEKVIPADEQRRTLKLLNRQYNQSNKIQTMMKNNLISLTDSVFPGINKLFTSPERQSDGHEKWVDFLKGISKNHSASDAQSDFSSDCTKISQAYWRMSRNFGAK